MKAAINPSKNHLIRWTYVRSGRSTPNISIFFWDKLLNPILVGFYIYPSNRDSLFLPPYWRVGWDEFISKIRSWLEFRPDRTSKWGLYFLGKNVAFGVFQGEPGPSAFPNDSEKTPDWITSLSPGWSGKPQGWWDGDGDGPEKGW